MGNGGNLGLVFAGFHIPVFSTALLFLNGFSLRRESSHYIGAEAHRYTSIQMSWTERLHGLAVYRDVDQHWGAANIHVPKSVMNQLVVPLALPRFQIHSHDTLAEQAVARTMTAIKIAGRKLYRQVSQAEIFIDADLGPRADVAGVLGGIFFPSIIWLNSPGFGMVWKTQSRCPSSRRTRARSP